MKYRFYKLRHMFYMQMEISN